MKKKLIIGNWKMHLNTHDASVLVHRLHITIPVHRSVEVVLAPSMLSLQPLSLEIDRRQFKLAAQNAYYKDEGAFTGEVSYDMLRDLVHYAIVGHSERRIYFNETLEVVREKTAAAVRNGIVPIVCVGDTSQERSEGESKRVVHDQVTTAVQNLTSEDISNIVIAYEPVWAITTFDGVVAKPSDIQDMLAYIRSIILDLYGAQAAEDMLLLNGGSVNPDTAAGYFSLPDCDGAIVGGASLNYKSFAAIVAAAYQVQHENPDNGGQ
ncbi:MAG: tpiA [Candidatus Saccharibacteria bacterium]|nr:tpiA [Candidatus Saccharibacteria bacterium]